MRYVNFTVAMTNYLGTRYYLWRLNLHRMLCDVWWTFSLRLCSSLHHLTDFVGCISRFYSVKWGFFVNCELWNMFCATTVINFRVIHFMLLLEAAELVATFLGSNPHVMKFSLFCSHLTAVTVECIHSGVSTAVIDICGCHTIVPTHSVSDCNSSHLSCSQFLNKTVRWSDTRLGGSSLICRLHWLNYEVFVVIVAASLHLDWFKLFLQGTLLNAVHKLRNLTVTALNRIRCRLINAVVVTKATRSSALANVSDFVTWVGGRDRQTGHSVVFLNLRRPNTLE